MGTAHGHSSSETTTEMPYPEERRDDESHEEYQRRLEEFHRWDEGWLQDQRERRRREKAYLEARGPLSLLQAVYCDPCKAKVLSSIFLFCFQICHLSFLFVCLSSNLLGALLALDQSPVVYPPEFAES